MHRATERTRWRADGVYSGEVYICTKREGKRVTIQLTNDNTEDTVGVPYSSCISWIASSWNVSAIYKGRVDVGVSSVL